MKEVCCVDIFVSFAFAGPVRNIYFPFDTEADTALSVATEMVAELDITDQDVTEIAKMIDGEMASLVPEWRSGVGFEDSPNRKTTSCCHACTSDGPDEGYTSSKSLQMLQCSNHGCGVAVHSRFEEIMFRFEGDEPRTSHYNEAWPQQNIGEAITSVD